MAINKNKKKVAFCVISLIYINILAIQGVYPIIDKECHFVSHKTANFELKLTKSYSTVTATKIHAKKFF